VDDALSMAGAFSQGAQLRCRLARESGDSSEDVEASASCYARLVSWDSGDGVGVRWERGSSGCMLWGWTAWRHSGGVQRIVVAEAVTTDPQTHNPFASTWT